MILPIKYQISKGTKALNKDIPMPFWKVCCISIVSELLITVLIFCFPLIFDERAAIDLSATLLAGLIGMIAVVIATIMLQLIASDVVNKINKKRGKKQAE